MRSLLGRSEWKDSVRRRVALQLAMADGISSLTLLNPSERETYEDRAVQVPLPEAFGLDEVDMVGARGLAPP